MCAHSDADTQTLYCVVIKLFLHLVNMNCSYVMTGPGRDACTMSPTYRLAVSFTVVFDGFDVCANPVYLWLQRERERDRECMCVRVHAC